MASALNGRSHGGGARALFLILVSLWAQALAGVNAEDRDDALKIYLVTVSGSPVVHYNGGVTGYPATASGRFEALGRKGHVQKYASYLEAKHDQLLSNAFPDEVYKKLYSYKHLVNGFAVQLTEQQASLLRSIPGVVHVEEDERVQTLTTHTPEYLGLPNSCWPKLGGPENAGEGVVIGIVDTGIDPTHPSFQQQQTSIPKRFTAKCEVAKEFPEGSCRGKLVGAQHFAAAAIASGEFNASVHFASPLDADGHGTHTAATAAGKDGVPVVVNGFNFGSCSGMAPRAQIAVYKALFRYIGGFFADVVAAIDQAVGDGVDILSLSVGPNGLPRRNLTFTSTFDLALLSAVKAGVFVTQAVGNGGPYPKSILSFSPWIYSVAAAVHDRTYPNSITLGSNVTIPGISIAPGTNGSYSLVTANDALMGNTTRNSDIVTEECQDASSYNKAMVEGKIIVCSYSVRYLFGVSTLSNAVATAQALNAKGIVFVADPDLEGHNFQPVPIGFPAIIITTMKDATLLLHYYNTSAVRGEAGQISSGATASISGGEQAAFSYTAPRVATYSSRGPDVNSNNLDAADVLKPSILAPGSLIWAAWSRIGSDERAFEGQQFAMISGTSMATPHIAGIAALVKQKYPKLSPAAIASAMSTSAVIVDSNGAPLLAQHPSATVDSLLGDATPFDMGAGFVNPSGAIDPGLVFDAGFDDYVRFLCSLPSLSNATVASATGSSCSSSMAFASDLNMPYVSIGHLNGTRSVARTVTNVGGSGEKYTASISSPWGVSVSLSPMQFDIQSSEPVALTIVLKAISTSSRPAFGRLVLEGNQGHRVHVPLAISSRTAAP